MINDPLLGGKMLLSNCACDYFKKTTLKLIIFHSHDEVIHFSRKLSLSFSN